MKVIRAKTMVGDMCWAVRQKALFDLSRRSNFQPNNRLFLATFFSSFSRYSESQGGMVPEDVKDPVRGTTTTGMPPKRGKEPTDGGGRDEDADSGVTGFVAEKASEGTKKATETVVEVGDKTKEMVDDAWGAAKDTARKIEDTVARDRDGDKLHRRG